MKDVALTHKIAFTGSLWFDAVPDGSRPTLLLADAGLHSPRLERRLLGDYVTTVVAERRPDAAFVAALAEQASRTDVQRIAAIGDGALLDAAKLTALAVEKRTGHLPELVLVPCGTEPYRAVTRFAVVDNDGQRPTVVDERFGCASVVLAPELLAVIPLDVAACHVLDSAVHAIESLLSSLAHPFSRAQATAALRIIAEHTEDGVPASGEARTHLAVASFLAAEAFSSTRLGLAHALASPLGTELGVTHDTLNGVLGEAVVSFWGSDVPGFSDIAVAVGRAANPSRVQSWLGALRATARLPGCLRDLGVPWASVEAILPRASQSSGIAVLPRTLSGSALEDFARRAWAGSIDEEAVDAGVA